MNREMRTRANNVSTRMQLLADARRPKGPHRRRRPCGEIVLRSVEQQDDIHERVCEKLLGRCRSVRTVRRDVQRSGSVQPMQLN